MKWYKYPGRISKETNISFIAIWLVSIILQFLDKELLDWKIFVLNVSLIIFAYVFMVWIIKKTIWNKEK